MIMSIMTNPRIQSIAAMRVDDSAAATRSAELAAGADGGRAVVGVPATI
jgi:hypothetical protein